MMNKAKKEKISIDEKLRNKLRRAISGLVTKDLLPLSIIEGKGFGDLMTCLMELGHKEGPLKWDDIKIVRGTLRKDILNQNSILVEKQVILLKYKTYIIYIS